LLSNQEKIIKHQSQEILDHVSFYWNRFLEASKNVFSEMESFFQTNFPQVMKQLESYTKNLPSRNDISKRFEAEVMKPSQELLKNANIPKQYENYIIYTVFTIFLILVLWLTKLLIQFSICKPLRYICCRKRPTSTEETTEVTKEPGKEAGEPENVRKRKEPRKRNQNS